MHVLQIGTDSRLGVGFRLGQHADFQALVELGPQVETDKIGNAESKQRRQAMLDAAIRGDMGPWTKSIAEFNVSKMKNGKDVPLNYNQGMKVCIYFVFVFESYLGWVLTDFNAWAYTISSFIGLFECLADIYFFLVL